MIIVCEHCDTPVNRSIVEAALTQAGVPQELADRVLAQRFGALLADGDDRFTSREPFGQVDLTVGDAMTLIGSLQEAATDLLEERLEAGAYADANGWPLDAITDQDKFLDMLESFVQAAEAIRRGDQRVTLEIPDDAAALVDGLD